MKTSSRFSSLPFWALVACAAFGSIGCFGYAGLTLVEGGAKTSIGADQLRQPTSFVRHHAGAV